MNLLHYIRESKEELEKVTWPSRKDTMRYTILIVSMTIVLGLFFAGFDWLLNQGLESLIALSQK